MKNIVDKPIFIKVFSPICPNLTIIDLPGIIRNRKENSDQPENIGEITEKLALNYASEENTIIVVVHRGDIPMENSAGVKIASKADPEQKRTIGVLTSMDLPRSIEVGIARLEGEEKYLKLGWVGLKNRSSEDIKNGVTIQQARGNEKQFFDLTHPFSKERKNLFGVVSLCNKLIPLLNDICKQSYPKICDTIYNQLKEAEVSMNLMGQIPPNTEDQKRTFLI
jgi:vacuolar protein sorting-associated protein 1